ISDRKKPDLLHRRHPPREPKRLRTPRATARSGSALTADDPNGPFASNGPARRCATAWRGRIVAATMRTESPQQPPKSSSRWSRIGALLYDRFVWVAELAGMRRNRRALLAQASGRVLEIGAGTGLNLEHYPEALHELVLAEPEPAMRERLARRIDRGG